MGDDTENTPDRAPVPDPTKLTTDAVNAATDISRRELIAHKELAWCRMDGMEAVERELSLSISRRLEVIERLRVEQKQDSTAAVDAALAAQKEAIAKSEAATKEQIVALGTNAITATEGLRRDIDDLKRRVTIVESMKLGAVETKQGLSNAANLAVGVAIVIVAVSAIVVTVILANAGQ